MQVILLQGSTCLRINVTNPSNEDLKETGFKVSQTKEGSQALCRYMPDRQTDRQTDAGSSRFGDKYSITDHTIRLSEVAVPLNLKDPFLTDKENLGSTKGRLCWATRSWRWYLGLPVSFPLSSLSKVTNGQMTSLGFLYGQHML